MSEEKAKGLIPSGLENDLAYIDRGHDILHDEVKKGMPLADAAASLKELYALMDSWEQKYPSVRKEVLQMTANDMRELGYAMLMQTWSTWREPKTYAYHENGRSREVTYSLSDLRWAMDSRRARRELHAKKSEKVEVAPQKHELPTTLDMVVEKNLLEITPMIPIVQKTFFDKMQPYLAPVVAACVFLSVPLYKIVAKEPNNLDYVLAALMTLPATLVIRTPYLRPKEVSCG